MTRHERIRQGLFQLEGLGVLESGSIYEQSGMPGTRWNFVPCGFTERSLSTSQVEDFILGARAALYATAAEDLARADRHAAALADAEQRGRALAQAEQKAGLAT